MYNNEMEKHMNVLINLRDATRLIAEDMIDLSRNVDELLNYLEHPYEMILSNNIKKDLDEKIAKIKIKYMFLANKIETYSKTLNNIGGINNENRYI